MGLVAIDNLAPGMKLASDVHDRNGRLLLGADAELTDKHIYIFRTWGVVEADIAGVEMTADCPAVCGEIDPDVMAAAEAEVTLLFRHADLTHPCMKQLLRLAIQRKAEHAVR